MRLVAQPVKARTGGSWNICSPKSARPGSFRRSWCPPPRGLTIFPGGVCLARPPSDGGSEEDYAAIAEKLNRLLVHSSITAEQLRELVYEKWGRTYEVRLRKHGSRMYLQVMWKHLEQKSFPLSEEEYMLQLDAVASYLTEWGVVDLVRSAIAQAHPKGPGYTVGGSARCISIPLNVRID